MRFKKGIIIFSPKETSALLNEWGFLKKYTWHLDVEDMEKITSCLMADRTLTTEQWKRYVKWRQPMGSALLSPEYMEVFNRYHKKLGCPTCRGSGHNIQMEVCRDCLGSGSNQKLMELLGETWK